MQTSSFAEAKNTYDIFSTPVRVFSRYFPRTRYRSNRRMNVWTKESDGTYVAEMSDFGKGPIMHPLSREFILPAEFNRCLKAHVEQEEIRWWYGALEDGTRVLIYND